MSGHMSQALQCNHIITISDGQLGHLVAREKTVQSVIVGILVFGEKIPHGHPVTELCVAAHITFC